MRHPRRRTVTASMVGLKTVPYPKISPKTVNPRDLAGGTQKMIKKKKKKKMMMIMIMMMMMMKKKKKEEEEERRRRRRIRRIRRRRRRRKRRRRSLNASYRSTITARVYCSKCTRATASSWRPQQFSGGRGKEVFTSLVLGGHSSFRKGEGRKCLQVSSHCCTEKRRHTR